MPCFRRFPPTLALLLGALLPACPQLLSDDFARVNVDDDDPIASGARGGWSADAGLAGAGGTGGTASGGNGGDGTATGGDAGSGGDAGAAGSTAGGGAGGSGAGSESDAGLPTTEADASCGACEPEFVGNNPYGAALVHRYRFRDTGTALEDLAGSDGGVAVNATLDGSGSVTLSAGQYLSLPSGLISSLASTTIEVWANWSGGAPDQRIFDFGYAASAGGFEVGDSLVMLSPSDASGNLTAGFAARQFVGLAAISGQPFGTNRVGHAAVVVDGDAGAFRLYQEGVLAASRSITGRLDDIDDVDNWIGRSQISTQPGFEGSVIELRIYDVALGDAEILTSFNEGPDAAFE